MFATGNISAAPHTLAGGDLWAYRKCTKTCRLQLATRHEMLKVPQNEAVTQGRTEPFSLLVHFCQFAVA